MGSTRTTTAAPWQKIRGRFALALALIVATLAISLGGGAAVASPANAQPTVAIDDLRKACTSKTVYGKFCLHIRRTGDREGIYRNSLGPGASGTFKMVIVATNEYFVKTHEGYVSSSNRTFWTKRYYRSLHPYVRYQAILYKKTRQNSSPRPPYYWRKIVTTPGIGFPDCDTSPEC